MVVRVLAPAAIADEDVPESLSAVGAVVVVGVALAC